MTSIIPLTLLSTTSREDASLFLRTSTLGHFGLLPLLFRPAEAMLKFFICVAFLSLAVFLLEHCIAEGEENKVAEVDTVTSKFPDGICGSNMCGLLRPMDKAGLVVLCCLFAYMEIIHPLFMRPKNAMEFLPLLATSVICAIGLVGCWLRSLVLMIRCVQSPPLFVKEEGNASKKKKE